MQYCLTSLLKLYQASMENFLSNSKLGNYVGVGEEEKVQLYYYFVESERDPENDPLMLWLTGGPGCSGLSSFVYEIGPLTFDYANSIGDFPKLELKSNSWTKVANIIFIDQPAGSGYSYAKTSEAYNFNDTLAVALTYEFLRKWLMDHPEFLKNPLYVSGDSYSGIFVALLTRRIYDGIEVGEKPRVNIKGYIQGNALTDHYIDFNGRVIYAHRMGLISDKIYQSTKANCNGNYAEVDPNNVSCLNDLQRVDRCLKNIRRAHILEPWCDLPFLMSILKETPANARSLFPIEGPWCREKNYIYSYVWANDKAVKKALNVREGTTLEWVRCNDSMHYRGKERTESYVYDVKSVIDDHRHLISKSCRALIYSGDHDMVVPHSSTEEWIDSLKLPITDDWEPWFVDGQVAGYKVKYSQNDYEMTYATVKGGGHTAPEYKPEQCLAMVDRWFSGYPL
ncbi:serine carboxypeptidase-like 18 isoform X2 [Nicotiana tabacum]|uniref:Serine carboxypeptidase-like 18 isoform X2 n=1 Tax=Nicotiana tabacum TaxID=4097 RepID=A0A1S4CD43_TOBAC|nr:serine carboxypeptidase-like 18 isoform X2 [Nicotiana tomentosiformis]XP_016499068.1 PREDICTED: serine carboxypeptidase-like 18 isoform X2 [Nicotiana tabacum]